MCGILFKTQNKSRNKMILLINTNTKVKEVGSQGYVSLVGRERTEIEGWWFSHVPCDYVQDSSAYRIRWAFGIVPCPLDWIETL